jgi:hypothetical protein
LGKGAFPPAFVQDFQKNYGAARPQIDPPKKIQFAQPALLYVKPVYLGLNISQK